MSGTPFKHPAYIEAKKVCEIPQSDKCIYQTQGQVVCTNGPVTAGAGKRDTTEKLNTPKNDRMFQLFVDPTVWR